MTVVRKLLVGAVVTAFLAAIAGPALAAEILPDGTSVDVLFVGHFKIHPHATHHGFDNGSNMHEVWGNAGLQNNNDTLRKGHCRVVATFWPKHSGHWKRKSISDKFAFRVPAHKFRKYPWATNLKDRGHHYNNVPSMTGHCHTPS